MGAYYYDKYKPDWADGDLLLFTIHPNKSKSRSWYFRLRTSNNKYYQRSLKESDRSIAELKARELWFEIKSLDQKGILYTDKTVPSIFKAFIESGKYGSKRKRRLLSIKKYICHDKSPLRNIQAHQLTNRIWLEFIKWRAGFYLSDERVASDFPTMYAAVPRIRTLQQDRAALLGAFKWAKRQGTITNFPDLQPISRAMVEREGINARVTKQRGIAPPQNQWRSIKTKLRLWAFWDNIECYRASPDSYEDQFSPTKSDIDKWIDNLDEKTRSNHHKLTVEYGRRQYDPRNRFARKRLYYFLLLSEATLLRPTIELASTRWCDYETIQSKHDHRLRIPLLTTHQAKASAKTTDGTRRRTAVGLYRSYVHFQRWREISRQYGYGKDEDYIFPLWVRPDKRDEQPQQHCDARLEGRSFTRQLRKWDLDKVPTGQTLTLYSCRHAAIVSRIRAGWNVLDVATAAGNSVSVISDSYAKEWQRENADKFANNFVGRHIRISEDERDAILRLFKAEQNDEPLAITDE